MKSLWYRAQLESDVVITARSATVGAHETLDYLPGATFLGAIAARLYRTLSPEDAFTMFHSGEIIFCDGRPSTAENQSPALPMPLSLHSIKVAKDASINNFAHPDHQRESGQQYKQLRQGYIRFGHGYAERYELQATSTRAKVGLARSPLSRRQKAEDNQLYTYNAIAAGACFIFEVRALTPRAEELLMLISNHLGQAARLRIGRSKRAEYGAVICQEITQPPMYQRLIEGEYMSFLALSDCALRDPETGAPSLLPTAQVFGLPRGSEVKWSLTHIRRRNYSPFNGKRARVDLERQVLTRGSVVTFKLPPGIRVESSKIEAHLSWGVGEYTESGLGQWALNLYALQATHIDLREAETVKAEVTELQLPLIDWARRTVNTQRYKADAGGLAVEWEQSMKAYCGGRNGLSRAQLGTLRAAGERLEADALFKALFDESGDFSVCATRGVRAKKWIHNTRGGVNAAEKLRRLFEGSRDQKHLWSLALQATASRLVKSLNRKVTTVREEP